MIRLALIGLGNMGMAHLAMFAGLAPRVQITAVADAHAPFADRAGARAPSATVFYDPLNCARTAGVDAAVVATTDDTHHGIVDACIARGIYVLCEKPLTASTEDSRRLVDAEHAHGRRLVQVGYMRRYDDDYRRMHDMLRSGRVGDPILITQRHRNPLSVNDFDAEKLILSTASHDVDLFRWFTGDEITQVSATAKASHSALTVLLTLTSRSGVLGVVEVSRGPGLRYDIGCDILTGAGGLTLAAPTPVPDSWFDRFAGAYRAQNAAWLAAVVAGSITGPSTYDGYAGNAVAEAALAALRTGRAQPVCQAPA
ncbi:Gfo/Idh/MocA family protein [Mycobacterium sp. pUA109]|uniref:Gfo/Idh/MocA family protein n=1 Tax=Mycobacterium sp. pUA109 TaxID=3238982 RepID=UPI00351AEC81